MHLPFPTKIRDDTCKVFAINNNKYANILFLKFKKTLKESEKKIVGEATEYNAVSRVA